MMNEGLVAMAMPMHMPLHLNPAVAVSSTDITLANSLNSGKRDDRIPQWGFHETKDFIAIRAELEKDFTQTKRNKTLWEMISSKMRERGYRRSAEQCKCKWKNLVNRYKMVVTSQGKETSEVDSGRHCPFFEELHAVFTERAKNMDKLLLESEVGTRPKKKNRKGFLGERSSEDFSDDDEDEDEESEDDRVLKTKKRKADRERQRVTAEKCRANSMQEVLEDFFQQQQRIEMQWREALERREQDRRLREQEWREAMEKLEKERILREQVWREREEQRRAREEARSEKRDALFTALLARLAREEL
eukprot:c24965_g2_i1 orf=1092-2003(-)